MGAFGVNIQKIPSAGVSLGNFKIGFFLSSVMELFFLNVDYIVVRAKKEQSPKKTFYKTENNKFSIQIINHGY
jgi:hypothetical protein